MRSTGPTVTDSTPTEDKSVINQWKYIWSGLDRYAQTGCRGSTASARKNQRLIRRQETAVSSLAAREIRPRQQRSRTPYRRLQNSRSSGRTKAGKTVTNDYLGYDLTASFKLQAATSSDASFDAGSASWMDADALFTDGNARSAILNANEGNPSADWSERIAAPSLTGKINAAVWKTGKR